MIRKSLVGLALLSIAALSGCAEEKPTNTMEGVDKDELAAYEAMIAEEEQQMSGEDKSAIDQ
ncbi:MAG: hypothetical protein AAFX06_28870 [Planctomycetota bacterium]